MTSSDVVEKVDALLKGVNETLAFRPGAHLRVDLQMDSLDVMTFFFDVERAFSIKIPEEAIQERKLLNLDRLVEYLLQQSSGSSAS